MSVTLGPAYLKFLCRMWCFVSWSVIYSPSSSWNWSCSFFIAMQHVIDGWIPLQSNVWKQSKWERLKHERGSPAGLSSPFYTVDLRVFWTRKRTQNKRFQTFVLTNLLQHWKKKFLPSVFFSSSMIWHENFVPVFRSVRKSTFDFWVWLFTLQIDFLFCVFDFWWPLSATVSKGW